MDFLEVDPKDVLIVHGAMLGMSIDHNGDTFYVLSVVGGDTDGAEHMVTFAIPPSVTQQFLRIVNGMDAKREQPL